MKAIETTYRGYRFRSRTEARWAIFFNAMGYKWDYEPEGFELAGGVMYLPDFKIVSPDGWINWYEVKPSGVTEDEKVSLFRKAIKDEELSQSITILDGEPARFFEQANSQDGGICPRCGGIKTSFDIPTMDCGKEIAIYCWPCDVHTPCGSGHPVGKGMFMDFYPHKGSVIVDRGDWREFNFLKIPDACAKARSARFEHGERESMARL